MVCDNCRRAGAKNALACSGATLPEVARAAAAAAVALHAQCDGGTRCDCQHGTGITTRPDRRPDPRRGA